MLQNRRSVFLFICSIVLIQALYYIVTLQIKKTDGQIFHSLDSSLSLSTYNQLSDKTIQTKRNTTLVQVKY